LAQLFDVAPPTSSNAREAEILMLAAGVTINIHLHAVIPGAKVSLLRVLSQLSVTHFKIPISNLIYD
jgi:hypothetical protein